MLAGLLQAPKVPKCAALEWFDPAPGVPNDTEILFFALLLVQGYTDRGELRKWALAVLEEAAKAKEAGE